jgi:genome maintenance exonuclease 1
LLKDPKHFRRDLLTFEEVNTQDMPYGRGYVTEIGTYPSITTVLGDEGKEGLEAWRKRVGAEEAERVSKRATTKGTAVHEMCELYLQNSLTDITKYTLIERDSFLRIKPILDEHVNDVIAQETPLFSHHYKIAGRVDLIAHYDGVLSIIDFKTANKTKERDWVLNYFVQETAYALMLWEMRRIKINRIVTIITVEHDEPQVFIENPAEHFEKFRTIRANFAEKHGV